jgi:hypothetical protein
MTRVNSGIKFELRVKKFLEKQGYFCVRSAGSRGVFDLIAWNDNHGLMIQCKSERKANISYEDDFDALEKVPCPANWQKQLWIKSMKDVFIFNKDGNVVGELEISDL